MDLLPRIFGAFEDLAPRLLRMWGWRSRWLPTSAGALHVFDVPGSGDGPPLVLIHGLGSRASDYALLVRALRPHTRRILLPDLPGHGWSPGDAPDPGQLSELVAQCGDELLPEPSYVLGNSMGGLVAVKIALARPERVRALLLVSPAGAPLDERTLGGLRRLFGLGTHAEALAFVDRLLGPRARFRQLLAMAVRARLGRPAVRGILSRIRPEDLLTPEQIGSLPMPVWLFWGARDRILGADQLAFYRAALPPGAAVETPERHSHSPFMVSPRSFARHVRAWLDVLEHGEAPHASG